jgi:hypothetical protein
MKQTNKQSINQLKVKNNEWENKTKLKQRKKSGETFIKNFQHKKTKS